MEAAVLRVKRKRGADPVEALIISCKRPRAEDTPESGAVTTQVFKLAATVTSQNEPVQKYVQEALSRDRANQVHRPPIGNLQQIQKDLRTCRNAERQESRYRLVSSLRPKCEEGEDSKPDNSQPASPVEIQQHVPEKAEASSSSAAIPKGGKDETFQVFDIVQEETEKETLDQQASDPETIMCNSVQMIRERLTVSGEGQGSEHRENPEEFVYDIYYAESSPHKWIQDILSVQPYHYEQELMNDDVEPDEVYEDEDDENEEGNWRNDYPDEEDDEENSDREERYMGYYEEGDECGRGHAWDVYHQERMKEYDEDSD
ncbi:probable RNA polymerase II nuclear localization protein SLC7A6OS [Hyla sarda]|uniref:probable RNA polymerase II nuclear localization protein SLC7A6OS n=1 Tax=Hyla sarda TaxID=327740 RepID=UPI0024C42DFB|nr:probable RNA polymerase II nuclear localization protein SLC7A6OS [Hyla sarda]